MNAFTVVPDGLLAQQEKAEGYLNLFSKFTLYKHRKLNPYLDWLLSGPDLDPDAMCLFFNFWYPVSRHQPQILLRFAAAFPDWHDRKLIMGNYLEEDGLVNVGDDPHYVLLEQLIVKLGGKLNVDPQAEELVNEFHKSLDRMTPAQAIGYLAAIEHPALDISDYFQLLTRLAGREDLLETDPYLYIHVKVEPKHIIWSHGNALSWMEDEQKQLAEGYTRSEVVSAFQNAMSFWDNFWKLAFQKLGYK
ncbi:MAG TPA: hypothetical protein VHQ20_02805 [Patescibacteria group bacterium]|jgi:hypothetical protein|nr:hypothetical protein [Patescibacteria group bacterium]